MYIGCCCFQRAAQDLSLRTLACECMSVMACFVPAHLLLAVVLPRAEGASIDTSARAAAVDLLAAIIRCVMAVVVTVKTRIGCPTLRMLCMCMIVLHQYAVALCCREFVLQLNSWCSVASCPVIGVHDKQLCSCLFKMDLLFLKNRPWQTMPHC